MWQPEMFVDVGTCPLGWGVGGSHLTGEPLFKSDVHTGIVFETKSQLKAQRFLVLRCVADIWGKRSQSSWIPVVGQNEPPKCSCVYAALLPSFISRGRYRRLQAKPTFWVLSELFSQGSPDCRTSGLFQNRLLFPYLCWVSGLGLISRKIPWNCIFFCHRSMEESPSDIATKLLRVPMTFWSSFLSACQMWLFFSLVPKFYAGKMRV